MGIAALKSKDVAANGATIEHDVERLSLPIQLPPYARHADIGAMHQCKTVPCRRFPEKMKAIRATMRQFRALPSNIFPAGRPQLVPDVAGDGRLRVSDGGFDPRRIKRGSMRSSLRFEHGGLDGYATDHADE